MATVSLDTIGKKSAVPSGDSIEFVDIQPQVKGLQFWFENTTTGAVTTPAWNLDTCEGQFLSIVIDPAGSLEHELLYPIVPGWTYIDLQKFNTALKIKFSYSSSIGQLQVVPTDRLLPPLPPLPGVDPRVPPLPPLH